MIEKKIKTTSFSEIDFDSPHVLVSDSLKSVVDTNDVVRQLAGSKQDDQKNINCFNCVLEIDEDRIQCGFVSYQENKTHSIVRLLFVIFTGKVLLKI